MPRTIPWKQASTPENVTVSTKFSSTKQATTFLDLPGELRNQVYGHLLPDVDRWYIGDDDSLRQDGQDSSTNFMSACRQVHDEAVSILYGSEEFHVSITSTGTISFLNQYVPFSDVQNANFAAINQIKVLDVHISANDRDTVCNVQDALFAFFNQLLPKHKLHTLNVHIDIEMTHDFFVGYELFSSNQAGRMFHQNLMREFRDIKPGDISRAHLTAFLTDPLRTIRNLQVGKKKGKFTLDFSGKSGKPWRDIQVDVRTLVQGDTPVPDYQIFCPYFKILTNFLEVLHSLSPNFSRNSDMRPQLTGLRIRGNIDSFRRQHSQCMVRFDQLMNRKSKSFNLVRHEEAQETEHKIREAIYLAQELYRALPADDADTSFFGYNKVDDALREWQRTGRWEAKAAKEKRKREREAASTPSKKAKATAK